MGDAYCFMPWRWMGKYGKRMNPFTKTMVRCEVSSPLTEQECAAVMKVLSAAVGRTLTEGEYEEGVEFALSDGIKFKVHGMDKPGTGLVFEFEDYSNTPARFQFLYELMVAGNWCLDYGQFMFASRKESVIGHPKKSRPPQVLVCASWEELGEGLSGNLSRWPDAVDLDGNRVNESGESEDASDESVGKSKSEGKKSSGGKSSGKNAASKKIGAKKPTAKKSATKKIGTKKGSSKRG